MMNFNFWRKKQPDKQKDDTKEVNRYMMVRIFKGDASLGAVSVISPAPDKMRSYLDELEHIKKIDINDELYYVPIGVLYEATYKTKKEEIR